MKATSALQAAFDFGGWNLKQNDKVTAKEILEYFTEHNFRDMFGDNQNDCGGYTLEECASAVIEFHDVGGDQ